MSNIKFAKAGENSNPNEYADKQGKQTPTPTCVNEDGSNKYAEDGLTQDFDPSTPHVTPVR